MCIIYITVIIKMQYFKLHFVNIECISHVARALNIRYIIFTENCFINNKSLPFYWNQLRLSLHFCLPMEEFACLLIRSFE